MPNKSITIVSGGLDSVTLAYYLKSLGYEQTIVTFNYGQRHSKEIDLAANAAIALSTDYKVIAIPELGKALKGSALTDKHVAVPEGHYAADNMAITVVPNRNAIMLSIAWGIACAERATVVGYAAHAGDHAQYPDCRLEFVNSLNTSLKIGTIGCRHLDLHLIAPFITKNKAEIVKLGHELRVPFFNTWSCYKGGEKHCGKCGTCVERLEAFEANALRDPVEYEDREYWREVTMKKSKESS